jgi:uncharacterized protein (DUF983 family)
MNAPVRWQPDRAAAASIAAKWPMPTMSTAIFRGLRAKCPSCGQARLFQGYLTVTPECPVCSAPLGLARADDAPPYFTILIVAHVLVPSMLLFQGAFDPSDLTMACVFLPAALALTLGLLRPVKGGTVGLMMKLGLMKSDADE